MQIKNLSIKLLAASHAHARPRFATQIAIALISLADNDGVVRATRHEIAALVDRSDYNLKLNGKRRLTKISSDYRKLEMLIAKANKAYLSGTISGSQLEVLIELLNRQFFKAARSPTLANVSHVISYFRECGLVEIQYRDKGGVLHDTTSRGRVAQYKLIDPPKTDEDQSVRDYLDLKDSNLLKAIFDANDDWSSEKGFHKKSTGSLIIKKYYTLHQTLNVFFKTLRHLIYLW